MRRHAPALLGLVLTATFTLTALLPRSAHAVEAVGFCTASCNGTGTLLAALSDGTAYIGRDRACIGCPPVDSLIWRPVTYGNILASAGRPGDQLLAVFNIAGFGACSFGYGMTDQGYLLSGTPEQPWGVVLDVFAALGEPREPIAAVSAVGSEAYLLTRSARVLRIAGSPPFLEVRPAGRLPDFLPTFSSQRTWGQVKLAPTATNR
ncbi:MAG: hypothetical protein U0704_04465 [Candidatus Eisenbacteria bacterium]